MSSSDSCSHGQGDTPERADAVYQYAVRAQKEYQEIRAKYQFEGQDSGDHRRECVTTDFNTLEEFWTTSEHARLVDVETIRYCYAFATDEVLRGATRSAYRYAFLGNYLATYLKLGDQFLETLRGVPVKLTALDAKTMHDWRATTEKIATDRELILFLSKQIPCSCLMEDKKNAKQAPKTGRCRYCCSVDLKGELRKCSQCKSVQYCSRECQVADWKAGHKKDCKVSKKLREQKAELKAETWR
jgi:hypothetical protein